jgi:UDP-N-acetylmuramoyl-tripeptide--D-alanyl-D-alanine ligase
MVAPMNRKAGAADAGPRAGRGSWMTAAAVAKATAGEVLQRGVAAGGVETDSRKECAGKLFVAIRGDKNDGHAYLEAVVQGGAAGLIVDRPRHELPALDRIAPGRTPFVVRVGDTTQALLDLAAEHRRRMRAKVVGITGSCGKTSTKEWLGAVLASAMPTVRSPQSFNNQIGVPITLFGIQPDTRAAVVEIGTNAPGEIAQLTGVARPDIGIVTCVAAAHLQGLGSIGGVAKEKSSLPAGLPDDGLCILNGDDANCRAMAAASKAEVQFFRVGSASGGGPTDWFATDVRFHALGTTFLLQGKRPVTLARLGTHSVYNALAVIAAASRLGVAEDAIVDALSRLPAASRRLEPKVVAGVTVFDDTYNMNPQSAAAALQALAGLAPGGRRIAVFGEMRELGAESVALHRQVGADVARTRQDLLVAVGGGGADAIADGAVAAGLPAARVCRVPDIDAALALLRAEVRAGDRVLCKASRGVQLDRLVDRLVADLGAASGGAGAEANGA